MRIRSAKSSVKLMEPIGDLQTAPIDQEPAKPDTLERSLTPRIVNLAGAPQPLWVTSRKPRSNDLRPPPPPLNIDSEAFLAERDAISHDSMDLLIRSHMRDGRPLVLLATPTQAGAVHPYNGASLEQYMMHQALNAPNEAWLDPLTREPGNFRAYLITGMPDRPGSVRSHYVCSGLSTTRRSRFLYGTCLRAQDNDAVAKLLLGLLCRYGQHTFPRPTDVDSLRGYGNFLLSQFEETHTEKHCAYIAEQALYRLLNGEDPHAGLAQVLLRWRFKGRDLLTVGKLHHMARVGLKHAQRAQQPALPAWKDIFAILDKERPSAAPPATESDGAASDVSSAGPV